MNLSPALLERAEATRVAASTLPVYVQSLPLELINVSNQREHWRRRSERVKGQRKAAAMSMAASGLRPLRERLIIVITRVAPHRLDDDNAETSAKPVRDGIADALLVNDRDPRLTWLVDQQRGGVREYRCDIAVWRWA